MEIQRNNVDGKYAEIQVIEKFVGNLGEHVKILSNNKILVLQICLK